MSKLLVLGMATIDFVFDIGTLPTEAKKYRAENVEIIGGGCAANAAVAIVRLGGAATLAARLGDDPLAAMIVSDLATTGINTSLMHYATDGRSSFSSVYVDAAGERQIMNFRGAGLTETTEWIDGAKPADAVLVDPRWPAGAAKALQMAKTWGVPGVLDAEAPIAPELLSHASHVAFSRTGLASLNEADDPAQALAAVAADLPGWACVTDGEHGVYFTGQSEIEHVPAFDVPVKDTLAAGDVWHGAFALALAENHDERTAIRFANAAAALKCTRFGGRAGCPDRAAVTKLLKETT